MKEEGLIRLCFRCRADLLAEKTKMRLRMTKTKIQVNQENKLSKEGTQRSRIKSRRKTRLNRIWKTTGSEFLSFIKRI